MIFYLIALWASITINFLIPRLAPGNPVQIFLARFAGKIDAQSAHALAQQFGLTQENFWIQYWQYLQNLLHGNLGLSLTYYPTPVTQIIAQDLFWTLILVGVSVVLSFIIGTLLGILIAWKRGSTLDTVLPPILMLFSAVPYFWLALVLLYVLGSLLNWFPLSGGYDTSVTPGWHTDFIMSVLQHATLPALTIVLSSITGWMINMRNMMITTLTEDYVLMAQAKGLPTRQVVFNYAARNAILPSITGFALTLGFVVGGSLLTEMIFSYPGIGFGLLQAVQNLDYPLEQGLFLVVSVAVLSANFLADLINAALDPRVR
jgi:peptide/nickel transport system permease protein